MPRIACQEITNLTGTVLAVAPGTPDRVLLLVSGHPHTVYALDSTATIPRDVGASAAFSDLATSTWAGLTLVTRITCLCASDSPHALFTSDGDVFIVTVQPKHLSVVHNDANVTFFIPAIGPDCGVDVHGEEVHVRCSPTVHLRTTTRIARDAAFGQHEFTYTTYTFHGPVVGFQLLAENNAFRRKQLAFLTGTRAADESEVVVFGGDAPVVYKRLAEINTPKTLAALPDNRTVVAAWANPFDPRRVLLADSIGRVLVYDTYNRWVVRRVQQFRDAQCVWVDRDTFLVWSAFRRVFAVFSTRSSERVFFCECPPSSRVRLFSGGEGRVLFHLNDHLFVLVFHFH